MSYLALMGLLVLIGLLNMATGLLQWLASPYGLVSGFIVINILLCVFAPICPTGTLMRSLCTRAGCMSR